MQRRRQKNATVDKTVASRDAVAGPSNLLPQADLEKLPHFVEDLRRLLERKAIDAGIEEERLKERLTRAKQAYIKAVALDVGTEELRTCEAALSKAIGALNRHYAEWRMTRAPIVHALRLSGDREHR